MATDLTVYLDNTPGALADLGETLGKEGVNLGGGCGVTSGDRGEIHLLVEGDAAAAAQAARNAGYDTTEREVAVVDVVDRPGELGEVARKLGDAGVNIDLFYLATNTRLVVAAADVAAVTSALS